MIGENVIANQLKSQSALCNFSKQFRSNSHPNGFYWGHKCSWTLTPAKSMQVPNMNPQQDVTRPKEVWGGWRCNQVPTYLGQTLHQI